jgi:hypothetical protein
LTAQVEPIARCYVVPLPVPIHYCGALSRFSHVAFLACPALPFNLATCKREPRRTRWSLMWAPALAFYPSLLLKLVRAAIIDQCPLAAFSL